MWLWATPERSKKSSARAQVDLNNKHELKQNND